MSGSLVGSMARAYRRPRAEMARLVDQGLNETRALFHLMVGCGLLFVASLPAAVRVSDGIETDDPVSVAITAYMFAYFFLVPLIFYGLVPLIGLLSKVFGGGKGFLAVRSAVFWAVLLGGPIAMMMAMVRTVAEAVGGGVGADMVRYLGYVVFVFWIWLLASSVAEAEGIPGTGRVAGALGIAFGIVAGSVTMLLGSA